ncbi:MAG: 30S ribosomal protein S18 [Candidatus Paceibacterota bacterium]
MTTCYFCQKNKKINYKETEVLKQFISGQMKIYPRRKTGLCNYHQNRLKKAIKRARILGLLPFVNQ